MIPRTDPSWQGESPLSWQEQLQKAITSPEQLLKHLELKPNLLPAAELASRHFPLRVPHAFIDLMEKGNPDDPLLKQVLPIQEELIAKTGYSTDPLIEQGNQQAGLIQKYLGRVLLMVNGHCAVNCRYCFRRHFPYEENRLNKTEWLDVIEQIRADETIEEVIYSGGDPLASNDRQLAWLTEQIAEIAHIKRLRIHSRLPVVIPERITNECLKWLTEYRLQTVFVLHINHPHEISLGLRNAVDHLRQSGITVLNQAVLLKGVNDTVAILKKLSQDLFSAGILPYYLHLLDPVSGASHFDLSLTRAQQLHKTLTDELSGYLVPKLVREIPGGKSKTAMSVSI